LFHDYSAFLVLIFNRAKLDEETPTKGESSNTSIIERTKLAAL